MLETMAAAPTTSIRREQCTKRADEVAKLLAEAYPDAHCELNHDGPYQLLVATMLSAQTTDRRVNTVTPTLFSRWPDPQALASADSGEVEAVVTPLGFGPTRAVRLVSMAAQLVDKFDGVVPKDLDSLVTLPGVGRKTANVVLGNAFGVPGITPDTHVMRVSRRLGWTDATTPAAVERDLADLFDPAEWVMLCHRLIWHGRRRCHARRPACGACPLAQQCPSYGEGPTDPEEAASLVRQPRR
ncbi:endonuclease III [Cutibacterium sp.]|uniref:endonuclease III n=1 Tax=Cutibacterium sp. TaxID=1912221 RepID=UPI0026DCD72F|nr:endonuclease III [Cutibacterium sp.]MDO4412716.1 endonuclease III [Cutibacterium sp.]